jgi:hypothetical protein
MGRERYPSARALLITADGGGSNGYRLRLWKVALQGFANTTGLTVRVCHFPPGTSKWNKIQHRMFSFISLSWRGRHLVSHEVIVNLIGNISEDVALIAGNPGIVSGWHVEGIPWPKLHFRAVVHLDDHTPFQDVTGVP